ncbi:hypothetical protein AX14_001295 [Amanita brunnescens Koide BX004]|nr:hypothetical protein AX14_001295 [Amanita brunnescens Koide BX004]
MGRDVNREEIILNSPIMTPHSHAAEFMGAQELPSTSIYKGYEAAKEQEVGWSLTSPEKMESESIAQGPSRPTRVRTPPTTYARQQGLPSPSTP